MEAALAHLYRPPVLPPGLPVRLTGLLTAMTARAPEDRPDAAGCARVLADSRGAGRTSPPAPGRASPGGRAARHVSEGPTGPVGSHTSARPPVPAAQGAAPARPRRRPWSPSVSL